jgi:amidase
VIDDLIDAGDVIAIRDAIREGRITSVELTQACIDRINARDGETRAVIGISPAAIQEAEERDERQGQGANLPLSGIPVLVKDNIETKDQPTTAGSLALKDNQTGRDAPIIEELRAKGAIILGKTNLSEWANFRSRRSSSGWSAIGGQTTNAHDNTRSPCGSSSGSAVAVAAGLAPLAIGTETNGSVICPAHVNGVVGIKPTVGVLSARHIVPISHTQDTAGPMASTVRGAALLLNGMQSHTDYLEGIDDATLQGKRIGIVRSAMGYHDEVDDLFTSNVKAIRRAGADVIDGLSLDPGYPGFRRDTFLVLLHEFRRDLNTYLSSLPNELSSLTLAKLIDFNVAHADQELAHFPQDVFLRAEVTLDETEYVAALKRAQQATRDGIDQLLDNNRLDALIAPTGSPAWKIDQVVGDHSLGGFAMFPAVACYPHVTVPMGQVQGLPVGLSFTGTKDSDRELIRLAHAFERNYG